MKYAIEVTATALEDSWSAYEWIRERAPGEAAAWLDRLFAAIESLDEMPRRCVVAPESRTLGTEIRQLVVGNKRDGFRVLFQVDGETVRVLHVRRGRRRWMEHPGDF